MRVAFPVPPLRTSVPLSSSPYQSTPCAVVTRNEYDTSDGFAGVRYVTVQNPPARFSLIVRSVAVSVTGSPASTRSATALTRSLVTRGRSRAFAPVGTAAPGER